MKRKNEKQNRLIKVILLVFLYAGILLICFPILKDSLFVEKTTTIKTTEVARLSEIDQIPFERIEAPAISDIMKSSDAYTSIGAIQLPSIGMSLPIFAGLSQEAMLYGAGSMYPERDPNTNNLVLLGHHTGVSDLLFGKLAEVKRGDQIYLRYLSRYYAYEIQTKKMVNETQINVLEKSTVPLLTLVTCDRDTATKMRLVVTAKPVKQMSTVVKTKMTHQVKEKQEQQILLKVGHVWLPLLGIIAVLVLLTYLIIKKV
ncbi:class A sortase [Enterococcus sp.]|uniref:class A sortase n=1 Tax=Enterococcus sp. TaxID=35783 RepID=UPI002907D5FA|nr:class A sortase [Enterococcus sp.]MDU5335448.1 class A sortase [Enterococcus sp.]